GFGRIGATECVGVPLELLTQAEGDVSEVVSLREPAGIREVRRCRLAGLAGADPLRVMAGRTGQRRRRSLKVPERRLGQEHVAAVVGQDHTLAADEQAAAVPAGNTARSPD